MKPFFLSISTLDKTEVAIFSNSNGQFVPLSRCKVSKRLKKIKREFKSNLCSTTHFCFSFMTAEGTKRLESMIK